MRKVSQKKPGVVEYTAAFQLRIPLDLRKRLRLYAAKHDTTICRVCTDALTNFLDEQDDSPPRGSSARQPAA